MIAEIGYFLTIVALASAMLQAVIPFGQKVGHDVTILLQIARRAATIQSLCLISAFSLLIFLFWISDFSVALVAEHSNSRLPLIYKISASWGNHEGSMLMWVTFLSLFSIAVTSRSIHAQPDLQLSASGWHAWLSVGFIAYMVFLSSPFERLDNPLINSSDLNPLLQHPAMAFHPPLLYLGYTGFSVVFAFSLASLVQQSDIQSWLRAARVWSLASWSFLTIGIAMGSWWAYYELGWGGFWFWDPVENAALVPWLTGVALIHCLAGLSKGAPLNRWAMALALMTFILCLCGAFLVRSGVLVSVHSFALSPQRGVFLLLLLGIYSGLALTLYLWRSGQASSTKPTALLSRENSLLVNNILIGSLAGSVLIGTLYPLFLEAFSNQAITVGPPFFNLVTAALTPFVAIAMGIGPMLHWGSDSIDRLRKPLIGLALATAIIATSVYYRYSWGGWAYGLGITSAIGLGLATGYDYLRRARFTPAHTIFKRLYRLPLPIHAMAMAHLGIAILIAAITGASFGRAEQIQFQHTGEAVDFHGYTLTLHDVREGRVDNYISRQATIRVRVGDRMVATLYPEKRFYSPTRTTTTESAVYGTWHGDLYVAIDDPVELNKPGVWVTRMWFIPLASWLWFGALTITSGGIMAWVSARRRNNQ